VLRARESEEEFEILWRKNPKVNTLFSDGRQKLSSSAAVRLILLGFWTTLIWPTTAEHSLFYHVAYHFPVQQRALSFCFFPTLSIDISHGTRSSSIHHHHH
jgi:hypothetical protein